MCGLLTLKRLNSISEITAVKPVNGRDTEMYPIEFNYIKSYNWVKVVSGRSKFDERQLLKQLQ